MNSRRATRLYNRAQRKKKREEKKLFNDCFKELKKIVFQHILKVVKQGITSAYIWEDELIETAYHDFPKLPPVREILDKIKNLLKKRGFIIEEVEVEKNQYGRSTAYSNKRWDISTKQLEDIIRREYEHNS